MENKDPKRPQGDDRTRQGSPAALGSSSGDHRAPETQIFWDEEQTLAGLGPETPVASKPPTKPPTKAPTRPPSKTSAKTSPSDQASARPAGTPQPGGQGTPKPGPVTSYSGGPPDETLLEPGTILAHRYEVLEVLGHGGMGSVYKAHDQELDRMVALKVIRPQLARITDIVDRFKQELRLSHQVTHKNVIRMYDLGEDDGLRFITMEFIQGQSLHALIKERGKFSPEETVDILLQVCRALEAAHSVGVIHRDLKPQNIMQDAAGHIVVMDFGLARTLEGDGMTQSGALVGTMEYMSPEQALGKELDQRSDIFALGLIAYEMLTGKMPFRAESALASLIKRTQERAEPVSTHDPAIPPTLSGVVSRCLERDITLRYKNTGEIIEDLEVWQGKRAAASLRFNPNVESTGVSGKWILIAVLIAALGVVIGGVSLAKKYVHPHSNAKGAAGGPSVSLAIMPFYNASGDPKLDWLGASVSETLSSSIGQSASLRMVSPTRLQQVLRDLHITGQSQVDVATLRRLAEFTSADTVIYGQYVKMGEQIQLDTTVLDLAHDSSSVIKTSVPQEKDLLTSVDGLATDIRQRLATDPASLKELQKHSQRPTTTSVEALHAYDDGLQLARQGNNLAAAKRLEAATGTDPNFALAFSQLGEVYSKLGHDDQAEKASRRAVELSDNLPAQEKNLIEANHARITKDTTKAIHSYEALARENPGDSDVEFALAGLYEQASDFAAAKEHLASVLTRDPKNVDVLLASGRVAIKSGDAQGGLDFLTRALTLAIQLDNQEEKAAILQASGLAYEMLNKPEDALRNYQESLTIKKEIGDKRGWAASLEQIAGIQDGTGHSDEALASYKEALALRKEIGDTVGIGNTLLDTGSYYHDHGKPDEALKYFEQALQIERDLGDESNQALCLNNIGTIRLDKGDYQDALTYLEQGYQLRQKVNVPGDIAESLHNLAEANTKLGQYDAALGLYLKAIEIRRAASDERGVVLESYSMATIFAAQGRYGAALSAMQDAYKNFQQSKEVTFFTVEIEAGWGDLLAQVGRGDEGQQSLTDALNVAHQINNDAAASLATSGLGDLAFYKGDYAAAQQQYDRALQLAVKSSSQERILQAKVGKARTDVSQGHAQAAIAPLRKLTEEADALGLKSLSVECSVYLGAAMVQTKDAKGARQQLDVSLARAEKLGLRVLEAKAHYQLAILLVQTGDGKEATPQYREVVRILQSISQEEGSTRVLERADLQSIYRDSMKGFQGN
ncbi:MAG TPA: tetratricopeptide repeat protein [Acidisarcina sp.]